MNDSHRRQPVGTPAGGQFAAGTHPESDTVLDQEPAARPAPKTLETGRRLMTASVSAELETEAEGGSVGFDFKRFVHEALDRHIGGDWGDCDPQDAALNDQAFQSGDDRIVSTYRFPTPVDTGLGPQESLWIITEWDRSCTTVLFPSEY